MSVTLADLKTGDPVAFWAHTYGDKPEVYIYRVQKITGAKRKSIWVNGLEFDEKGNRKGGGWTAPQLTVADEAAQAHAEDRRTRITLKKALEAVNIDALTPEQRVELIRLLSPFQPKGEAQ